MNGWGYAMVTNDWNRMVLMFMNCLRISFRQRRNFVYRLKRKGEHLKSQLNTQTDEQSACLKFGK